MMTRGKDPYTAERSRWWREARFGMFIHWGLYTIPARGEWVMYHEKVPVREYEKLRSLFSPRQGCARAWARLAKAAGMRYMVLTTKHHDGFCLFKSRLTGYHAGNVDGGCDWVREYVEACRAEGLRVGFYYSVEDWHHPDYPMRTDHPLFNALPRRKPCAERYYRYMLGQIRELLSNYGRIDVLWFDHPHESLDGEAFLKEIRQLQPDILVNNRVSSNRLVGDFRTPEQTTPCAPLMENGRRILWETCNTITGGTWGYDRYDLLFREAPELIRMIVTAAAAGGNMLLNVGPLPNGLIPSPVTRLLQKIGGWLGKYGESVYGTEAGPDCAWPSGRITAKDRQLYLHVLDWPKEGRLRLPSVSGRLLSASFLGGKEVRCSGGHLQVGKTARDQSDTVIVLTYATPPKAPPAPTKAIRQTQEARPRAPAPSYAVRPGQPVTLNGWIDPVVWQNARPVRVTQDVHWDWSRTNWPRWATHGYCAYRIRWMHADGILYGAVEIESADPRSRNVTWMGDSVEFFFAASEEGKLDYSRQCFHIVVDVNGRCWLPKETPGLVFRYVSRRTTDGFNVVIAVPFTTLLRNAAHPRSHIRCGDPIRANVIVNQADHHPVLDRDAIAWLRQFHLPWWKRLPDPATYPAAPRHRVYWSGMNIEQECSPVYWPRLNLQSS